MCRAFSKFCANVAIAPCLEPLRIISLQCHLTVSEGHCSCVGMFVILSVGLSLISVETKWKSQLRMKSLTYESNKPHCNACFGWFFWGLQYWKKKNYLYFFKIFIFAPCILKSILFTHQQMHYLLNLERFKIYTKIQTNIAPTCFGLRPSSGSLFWAWLKLY
jgi:hypothetical protein